MSKEEKVQEMTEIKLEKKDVKNPIDCLFDENNTDAIILFNEKGEEIAFDQIALIPKKGKTYAILQPIEEMDGVGEDEALVFCIEEPKDEDEEEYLTLVTDVDIIDEVFKVYDQLIEDEENKNSRK